jgi:mono/diheme cytochrome c family protein
MAMAGVRIWRWIRIGAAGVVLLAALGGAVVLAASEYLLRQHSADRAAPVRVRTDAASVAEGARLATVHGCIGCHGLGAGGDLLFDEPLIARVVAPNLTASVATRTTVDLVTAIRRGVRPDGRTMLVMPSQAFAPLTDDDLGSILGYLKSLPRTQGFEPSVTVGPIGRLGLVAGQFKTSLRLVDEARPPPPAADQASEFGRYLARTSCAPCHAADLQGAAHPEGVAPSLSVVGAYPPADFDRLMRSGIGLGNRRLGIMTGWAARNFASFSDAEVAALYRYLHTLPAPVAR